MILCNFCFSVSLVAGTNLAVLRDLARPTCWLMYHGSRQVGVSPVSFFLWGPESISPWWMLRRQRGSLQVLLSLSEVWEPNVELLTMLWDYFYKRLMKAW